jgi:hypothetical protein
MNGGNIDSPGGIDDEQAAGGQLDVDVIDMVDEDWYVLRARSGGGQWLATTAPVDVVE